MEEKSIVRAFEFEGRPVRVEVIDGEPWWVAKDVAEALGYPASTVATSISNLIEKVPVEWRDKKRILGNAGERESICLSEQGLYLFVLRSDKPNAIPFQKWVAGEVIPSIRRTGQYAVNMPDPTLLGLPDFRDPEQAAEGWLVQHRACKVAETQVKQLAAKIEQDFECTRVGALVMESVDTMLVGDAAKVIFQETGVKVGQTNLFEWMRTFGLVMRAKNRRLVPTRIAVDRGLLTVRHSWWDESDGTRRTSQSTGVTMKGLGHLLKSFHDSAALVSDGEVHPVKPARVKDADVQKAIALAKLLPGVDA